MLGEFAKSKGNQKKKMHLSEEAKDGLWHEKFSVTQKRSFFFFREKKNLRFEISLHSKSFWFLTVNGKSKKNYADKF